MLSKRRAVNIRLRAKRERGRSGCGGGEERGQRRTFSSRGVDEVHARDIFIFFVGCGLRRMIVRTVRTRASEAARSIVIGTGEWEHHRRARIRCYAIRALSSICDGAAHLDGAGAEEEGRRDKRMISRRHGCSPSRR